MLIPDTEQQREDRPFLYQTLLTFLSKQNVATLADEICKTLADVLKAQEAGLFLPYKDQYVIRGSYGLRQKRAQMIKLTRKSPFVARLKEHESPIIFKKQEQYDLEEFKILYLKKTLSNLETDYVVILKDQRKFIGFVVLGKPKEAIAPLDKDTVTLVSQLSAQAAVTLSQQMIAEEFAQIEEERAYLKTLNGFILNKSCAAIVFVDYRTEELECLNKQAKELFKSKEFSKAFIDAYKQAKLLRRSFEKPLFQGTAFAVSSQVFTLESVFIKRDKKGDVVMLVNK